jgi:hypothetical protein
MNSSESTDPCANSSESRESPENVLLKYFKNQTEGPEPVILHIPKYEEGVNEVDSVWVEAEEVGNEGDGGN